MIVRCRLADRIVEATVTLAHLDSQKYALQVRVIQPAQGLLELNIVDAP